MPLLLLRNDITKMNTDAVVLPANPSLKEGSGTSNAIYDAAGRKLLENELSVRYPLGCETGKAVITEGYHLTAKKIIHAVCPKWQGGTAGESSRLAGAYRESLNLAKENGLSSISFPLLSAGNLCYPRKEALAIATKAITDFLVENEMEVYLVFYDRMSFLQGTELFGEIREFIDDNYEPDIKRPLRRNRLAGKMGTVSTRCETVAESIRSIAKTVEYGGQDLLECSKLDLEDFLNQESESFHGMLFRLIEASGMKNSEIYNRANMTKQLYSKIKNNPDITPKKKTIIGFIIALRLDFETAQTLLMKAGYALSNSSKFDLIVSYFLQEGIYDCFELNEALFYYGLENDLIGYN